eukprot:6212065-Pleurochrysis_carterae.AAC.1
MAYMCHGRLRMYRELKQSLIRWAKRSDEVSMALSCNHEGKHLGSRGHALSDQRETNMYGPYSWHRSSRGKTDELHWAMGFDPGSFTYCGLTKDLP